MTGFEKVRFRKILFAFLSDLNVNTVKSKTSISEPVLYKRAVFLGARRPFWGGPRRRFLGGWRRGKVKKYQWPVVNWGVPVTR